MIKCMHSETDMIFLDTKVHLREGFLIPEIYSKPTDSHEYLNPASAHPPIITENIPYSVALRVRRNCSDRIDNDQLFIDNMISYKAHLMHSGYKPECIDKHFVKVAKLKRKDVLTGKCRTRSKSKRERKLNYVTAYNPMFPDIGRAIRSIETILQEDEECKKFFPRGAFRVAYKRGDKNLNPT